MRFLLPLLIVGCESSYPFGIESDKFAQEQAVLLCSTCACFPTVLSDCESCEEYFLEKHTERYGDDACPNYDANAAAACIDGYDTATCEDLPPDCDLALICP